MFERAGVSFSHVFGDKLPQSASNSASGNRRRGVRGHGTVAGFPSAQSVRADHALQRPLPARDARRRAPPVWWFGGGFDLTPYYPFDEDVLHWHRTARGRRASRSAPDCTPNTRHWCDRYFFLPHRDETRGVGGLFFDDLERRAASSAASHSCAAWAIIFCPASCRSSSAARITPWGERERDFQLYRRGRYVEFNLLYDRGTLFGLQSRGRTESILMSMPPLARWDYDWQPQPGSPEARLYAEFLRPRDYLAELEPGP